MRFFRVILCTVMLFLGGMTASAQRQVTGKVFLDPYSQVPGDYVMIYFPALSTGTMTDESGNFVMNLPSWHLNKIDVEYSRIGYDTVTKTVTLTGDVTELETVNMQVQTLMLTAAYVTPDGMSPSEFILSKVWEKTKENRQKELTYGADITFNFATHELPLVVGALPKGKVTLAKLAVRMMGYGSLLSYVIKNDDISAEGSLSRTAVNGKPMDFSQKITKSSPSSLPKGVQKDIFQLLNDIDLFELVYGETNDWGQKFSKKHKFKLVGTYEYGGRHEEDGSWSGREKITLNIHIVEEEWGILKIQCISREGEIMRGECRDSGNGVYMPVSFILQPTVTKVRNENIPLLIEEVDKMDQLTKSSKERARKILEERYEAGEDFNPYITCGFNVRYR